MYLDVSITTTDLFLALFVNILVSYIKIVIPFTLPKLFWQGLVFVLALAGAVTVTVWFDLGVSSLERGVVVAVLAYVNYHIGGVKLLSRWLSRKWGE